MISIIIPCYSTQQNNHGEYVKRAVQSALRQNIEKEIIVVDDGSPKPVHNIWGNPVRVIRHDRNRGLPTALNTGVTNSTGGRFIILASDDELRQDCLEKLSKQDADVVCSDFQGDQGPPIKCKPADLYTLINAGNCHSYAALIKRVAWDKTPGFRAAMNPSWEDWCAFIDLAKTGATWAYVPEALHLYHRSMTGRDADAQDKVRLLEGKLHGYHQDCFGRGLGVVTFIIPCYNQEQWLGDALESIRCQVYPHVNAVVVDDGSPGKVVDAVRAADWADVQVVRQRNRHLSGARNTGIRFALEAYNPQYLVMLDADDSVHPMFVEELMIAMTGKREYVYSDIQFTGDAWHQYVLKDYSCQLLTQRHIHACTFLAQSQMYQDVGKRGYIYDEGMKKGYEDWEFALAAMKAGWCGKRWPKFLFNYRQHSNGSMRMDAVDINNELVTYIKLKHSWIKNQEAINMACASCGGGAIKAVRVANKNGGTLMLVNVPGVGQVDGREPLRVVYTGHGDNIFTKLGVGGHIYKYSAVVHRMVDGGIIGPEFTIFGADAHLFVGAFQISRVQMQEPVQIASIAPQPVVEPVQIVKEPTEAQRLNAKFEQREQAVKVATLEPDDFTSLKGVGPAGAKALSDAGFAFYQDIVDASTDEVALVLKLSKSKAQTIQDEAAKKL